MNPDISLFVVLALITVLMALTARNLEKKAMKRLFSDNAEKKCPLHAWNWEVQVLPNGTSIDIQICKDCRMRPGMIQTSYDKPY